MLQIACQIQRATALKLGMAIHHEASFLRTARTVFQRIGSAICQHHSDALTIIDSDGRTIRVGQREAIEHYGSLEFAIHIEHTICGRTAEDIRHLISKAAALNDAHIGSADRNSEIVGHIFRYAHIGRRSIIDDFHFSCAIDHSR